MAFPVVGALLVFGALAYAMSSSSSSSGGGSGKGSGGGAGGDGGSVDLMTCAQAIGALPNVPGPGGVPSIQSTVQAALSSSLFAASQLEAVAVQLDVGAGAATDPKLRQAFAVAAACIRARKATAGTGTGGGPVDTMSCEAAFAALPPIIQTQIVEARKSTSPDTLENTAKTLDGLAMLAAGEPRDRLLQVAKCLRGGATIGVTIGGDAGKGGPGKAGVASPPSAQWYQPITASPPYNSASSITAQIFGPSYPIARQEELIQANNPTDANGLTLGPVRRDWPSGTPGQTPGVLNWSRLPVGARLVIPKAWNGWIDQTGARRGALSPWPNG